MNKKSLIRRSDNSKICDNTVLRNFCNFARSMAEKQKTSINNSTFFANRKLIGIYDAI